MQVKPTTIVLGVGLLFLLWGIHQPMNVFDEGFAVYNAFRVMNGEVPYKDFWMIYPPGQFYTLALLFKLFGANILVERIWDVLLRFAITVTVYVFATKLVNPTNALVPWVVVTLWLASTGFYGYAATPALLFILFGALCLFNFFARRRALWVFIGGLFVGISILFRHDLGCYALISVISVLALFASVHRDDEQLTPPHRTLSGMFTFLLGVSVPVVPMLIHLISVVPIHELWSDLIVNPITLSPRFYSLPLPPAFPVLPGLTGDTSTRSYANFITAEWVPFYLPFLIFGFTILALIKTSRLAASLRWGTMLLALLGVTFSIQAIRRADDIHFLPMTLIAVILLSFLLVIVHTTWGRTSVILLLAILIPMAAPYYIFKPMRQWVANVLPYSPLRCFSNFERSGCAIVDADQERAVQFIQTRVPRDEPIFVGNSRHDRIYVNDIMFYFLADRQSATKYHQLERSLVTTLPVQQEIVESLKSRQVGYVVLVSLWENQTEQNESGVSSGVTILDDFIRFNYQPAAHFGAYAIYKRR